MPDLQTSFGNARLFFLPLIAALAALNFDRTAVAQTNDGIKLVPTVTMPAPPGSRGFGMPSTNRPGTRNPGASMRGRGSGNVAEPREIVTNSLDALNMSDPYILADKATYYLTGSGGAIYKSKDLKEWTGPYGAYDVRGTWMEGINFVAAAEMHHINGKYYYVATFAKGNETG